MVPAGLGPMLVSTVHVLGSKDGIWWLSSPDMWDVLTHSGAPPLKPATLLIGLIK